MFMFTNRIDKKIAKLMAQMQKISQDVAVLESKKKRRINAERY